MENKQMKCIKGKSCLHCGSNYCRFVDELDQLKAENTKYKQTLAEIKEIVEECYYKCNSMNNCNISCKYYNNCNGEFSYLLAYLNKQISEVENDT